MKLMRAWSMPSRHTFTMAPIRSLIQNYVKHGSLWIDPYGGFNSPVEESNDINPEAPTKHHMDALEFVKQFAAIDGALFDPPYSPRQIHEAYSLISKKASKKDTQHAARLAEVKDAIAKRIRTRGIVISCGWNSNGMGELRGFEKVCVLLVAHGAQHNDTIVTVETRMGLPLLDG